MAAVITEVLHHLKTERRSAAANFHITLSSQSSSLSCTDSISNSNKRHISASNNLSKIIISNNNDSEIPGSKLIYSGILMLFLWLLLWMLLWLLMWLLVSSAPASAAGILNQDC